MHLTMNRKNPEGERRCYLCHKSLPLTIEFFPRDKNRSAGLGYQCRPCALRVRKERGDPRKNRWAKMTPEERTRRKATMRTHNTNGGWRAMRIGAYRDWDKRRGFTCDITTAWFKENIQCKPCIYCLRNNVRIGCDRINNSIGHTMANVVPACGDCNKSRQDIFTHAEMLLLGPHIAKIFAMR